MAVFVVEFSHGLSLPFMELSVSKLERDRKRPEGKPERYSKRSEDMQRARKRALQKSLVDERYKEPQRCV